MNCPTCNHPMENSIYGHNLLNECTVNLRDDLTAARLYADKLATGLPEGMLPKDVENLRNANAKMADELRIALSNSHAADVKYKTLCAEIAIEGQDPYGSIWEYAEKLRKELDAEKAAHEQTRQLARDSQHNYAEEQKAVSSIWAIFGNPRYEDLHGQSIFDLIRDTITQREQAETNVKYWVEQHDLETMKREQAEHELDLARGNLADEFEKLERQFAAANASLEQAENNLKLKEMCRALLERRALKAEEKIALMVADNDDYVRRAADDANKLHNEIKKRALAEEQLANVQRANIRQVDTIRQAREAQWWAQEETYKIRLQFNAANTKIAEYDSLFALQFKRMGEATAMWRARNGGNELISPDLGVLLTWLMDSVKSERAKAERLRLAAWDGTGIKPACWKVCRQLRELLLKYRHEPDTKDYVGCEGKPCECDYCREVEPVLNGRTEAQ